MKLYEILEPETEKKNTYNKVVGIDLGTTNSLVSIFENGEFKIIGDVVHSAVEIRDGKLEMSSGDNQIAIRSFKRFMGKSLDDVNEQDKKIYDLLESENGVEIFYDNVKVSPVNASARVLMELISVVQKHDPTINTAVITVPAYFDLKAREATIKAAELAGIEILRIISEPTSAAMAYGLNSYAEGLFAVYDFGGGTFDVSVLKINQGIIRVVATEGDNNLGGDDIDLAIAEHIMESLNLVNLTKAEWRELKEFACHLKEHFYFEEKLEKELFFRGKNYNFSMDKRIFFDLAYPFIQRTIEIFDSCLLAAAVDKKDLKGVIFVGGSSRLELVTKIIEEKFSQKRIFKMLDPEKVVAFGAAIYASNLVNKTGNMLVDVLPISIGLELMGGVNEKVILRNSSIPCSVKKSFTTYQDGQFGMIFNILQGERELAKDCRLLSTIELSNFPAKKAGTLKIEVEFNIDQDGILKVLARDIETGQEIDTEINPAFGVTKKDIEVMIDDSYKHAKEDIYKRKIAENKIKFSQMLVAILEISKNYPDFLTQDDCEKIMALEKVVIDEILNLDILENIIREIEDFSESLASRQLSYYLSKEISGKNIKEIGEKYD
jgi:molecular chaperone HscA